MFKVMLADSDADTLKNFRTYTKNFFPWATVVDTVMSPQLFMESVNKHTPDVVVFNIRFLGTALYATTRELSEKNPGLRFIVYGYYDDTQYIERIMGFGVVDYMYRPVKPLDFERAMSKAAAVFKGLEEKREERLAAISEIQSKCGAYRDIFLRSVVAGGIDNELELENSFEYFGIKIKPPFSVIMLKIDRFKAMIAGVGVEEKLLVSYNIKSIIDRVLAAGNSGVSLVEMPNMVTVITGGIANIAELHALASDIKKELAIGIKQSVTLGLGRIYKKRTEITFSYREAEAALRHRYYMGYGTILPIAYVEPENHITYQYPVENEEKLVYAAGMGEYEYCLELSKKLMNALSDKKLPYGFIPKLVMEVVFSTVRFASELENGVIDRASEYFPSKDMLALETPQDAYEFLERSLKGFCAHMIELRQKRADEITIRAKAEIESGFMGKLSLQTLAEKCETVPEYLSRIFNERENCSIYDYITLVRVNRSKRLLIESRVDEDTIAHTVGFDDYMYYRQVFRQYEGMLPSEYRLKYK